MVWIVWDIFTKKWLARAERSSKERIDDGDRFISLWIAFNGWMRGKYGENKDDRVLLDKVKKSDNFHSVFLSMKSREPEFSDNLQELGKYTVINMKHPNDPRKTLTYDGTFVSLIEVLYSIRCNLFHGRKDVSDNKKDIQLVSLAYRILLPLFKQYLKEHPL